MKRSGLAALLFAIFRSGDAREASVNADSVELAFGSRSAEIALGDIGAVEVKAGRRWAGVRLGHAGTAATVWVRLLDGLSAADWPDGTDHGPALGAIIDLLGGGIEAAEEAGEKLLRGRALAIWRRALAAGAAASLDLTLETLRQDDGFEACVSVCWMPASALAASPRRFVRLLGLNSARWPRSIAEDRLLSDHIVPTAELDPLPVAAADRRDFETILATTESAVVLSREGDRNRGHRSRRRRLLLFRAGRGAKRIRGGPQ